MNAHDWWSALKAEAIRCAPVYGPRPYATFHTEDSWDAGARAYQLARTLGPTAHVRHRRVFHDEWGWVESVYEVYP